MDSETPVNLFIASGEVFGDALSGAAAAVAERGPVLLVRKDSIPPSIAAELERLTTYRIVILGGPNTISPAVEKQLRSYDARIVERWDGVDRYATSAEISRNVFRAGVGTAYVASGEVFPTASRSAPTPESGEGPVLLVRQKSIPAPIVEELTRLKPKRIVVVGGSSTIDPALVSALARYTTGSVERWAGDDRYATASAVSAHQFPADAQHVVITSGEVYADALSGAPAARFRGAPILLVTRDRIPAATAAELRRIKPYWITILGGTNSVSDAVRAELDSYAAPVKAQECAQTFYLTAPRKGSRETMWKQIPTKRKRRHRTAVAASLLTAFAMTAPLGLAHSATPSNDPTCGGDPATGSPTVFRLSGAWSTWEGGSEARDFVRQALASMETERNIYGTKLTDWEETTGTGQDVTFKIANLPPGVAGEASCQSGEITFDSDFVASATAGNIRNAVRHEAMHYFGAAHTGEEDSRDGLIAGMKTCANGYNAANIIAQDDAATLQYVSDTTFSADPGFESTTHYYGLSGAPTATVLSGGGAGGSYRLRYKSTANGQSVYETTRAMLGHTSDFSIVARGRARGLPGIEAGTFYMQLWSRWVEYPHNNALACTPNQYTRAGILNPNGLR